MSQEINPDLFNFIQECLNRGFQYHQIRIPLIEKGWQIEEINQTFNEIKRQEEILFNQTNKKQKEETIYSPKNSITIHLDDEIMKLLEKRARKNMLTITEQVEDIIRRSCINAKTNSSEIKDNVEDNFLKLFSRKNTGRPRKEKIK